MTDKPKTLKRVPKKGQIAGVCAGIAEYFDLDVTIVRIIFVVLALMPGGMMVIIYIILAFILPVDESDKNMNFSDRATELGKEVGSSRSVHFIRNYIGIGLVALGAWLLLNQLFPELVIFQWDIIWPSILILVGALIIIRRK